ncbi:MAG: thiamine phosphate synthase [Candidatus Omnitrophica bacterium]|nr:thiamine phosphate synthase [Candidatus Omnitrophota bacterium]
MAQAALSSGADIIQLRAKNVAFEKAIDLSRRLKRLGRKYGALFIINDRIDLALKSGCDGLHIGQGDMDLALAKRLLATDQLIGVSIKNFTQAVKAKGSGADYLGVGPVFKTPIKSHLRPRGLKLVNMVKMLNIPFFAIGGINIKNISGLKSAGIRSVAVIRAVCKAKDVRKETLSLKESLS